MLDSIGPGHVLLADRAYDSNALRQTLKDRGAWANIKPISRRLNASSFSPFLYRYRNLVERFFNKLKHFRAIAIRYEKHAANYLALIKLAASRIWLRTYEPVTRARADLSGVRVATGAMIIATVTPIIVVAVDAERRSLL